MKKFKQLYENSPAADYTVMNTQDDDDEAKKNTLTTKKIRH